MSLFSTFAISASGMQVQQKRMDVTAENLANVNSTKTPEGGPYKRKTAVLGSVPIGFDKNLGSMIGEPVQAAAVLGIAKSEAAPNMIYDPSHPDANGEGYVAMPNVNTTMEMVDMLTASKAYEANVTVFNSAKSMMLKTMQIGGE